MLTGTKYEGTEHQLGLAGNITVFVISVGNSNYDDCIEALAKQNVKATMCVIKNIYPMDAAFQRMINYCKTPFFVQVDEDFVLYPNAIRTLYKAITAYTGYNFVDYPLWDEHLQMPISGIKIHRHSVFVTARYSSNKFSCEKDMYSRLEKAYGKFRYEKIREENCIGIHSPKWDGYNIYQRYRNLIEKSILFDWIDWPLELPKKFMKKFQDNPTELNFYALAGLIHGIVSDKKQLVGERDARIYSREEFKKIKELFYD